MIKVKLNKKIIIDAEKVVDADRNDSNSAEQTKSKMDPNLLKNKQTNTWQFKPDTKTSNTKSSIKSEIN